MAKSGWRGSGGASDGRIDLAPRRQRRLESKRANDKRHLNHPKAWAYVVDFFVAILSAKHFRKVLAAGLAPSIFFFFLFLLLFSSTLWFLGFALSFDRASFSWSVSTILTYGVIL